MTVPGQTPPATPPKRPTAAPARRLRSAARFHAVQAPFPVEPAAAGLETGLAA